MFFLLRAAFWIGLILVLIPSGQNAPAGAGAELRTGDAITAAASAIADATRFCERQPDACAVGSNAASAIGQRAQAGAKRLYGMVTDQRSGPASANAGAPAAAVTKVEDLISSQNSLSGADRAIPWRGPAARPEVVARRPS